LRERFAGKVAALSVMLAVFFTGMGHANQPELPAEGNRVLLWEQTEMVRREPVLLIEHGNGTTSGQLLFKADSVLRIYSPAEGRDIPVWDFTLDGERTLCYVGTGDVPKVEEVDLVSDTKTPYSIQGHIDGKHYLLYLEGQFYNKQVLVDYTTSEEWTGPVPDAHPEVFGSFIEALMSGEPVTVVLLGDSISKGANHKDEPPYIEQFVEYLRGHSDSQITLHNLSVGGKSSPWGLTQAEQAADLHPDLFIVAFGMNDASGKFPAEQYAKTIRQIVEVVQQRNPEVPCILVSGMEANPSWTLARPDLHARYHDALLSVAKELPNTVVCDVYSPWRWMVERKGFLSLTGNGVNHPNDYGHRLYADTLVWTLYGDFIR